MFERYTESARRAVFFARYEAARREAHAISPVHLLLGIARELWAENCSINSLKDQIPAMLTFVSGPGESRLLKAPYKDAAIPLDRDSKKALAHAAMEAGANPRIPIDPYTLLLGLLRFPNEASSVLETMGINLQSARAEIELRRSLFPLTPVTFAAIAKGRLRVWKPILLKAIAAAIVIGFSMLWIRWINR
jgi:ATP-dependent Clp protease ATP-binding subunit ClpC